MKKERSQEPWTQYSLSEEVVNAVTHGVGTLFSIVGLVFLVLSAVREHSSLSIASVAVYGVSLILLHLASTLYHSLRAPRAKRVFRIIDHCSIYVLIAGTYTPFLLIALHNTQGFLLLGIVWGLALTGIVLQVAFKGWFGRLSVVPYVGMGWLVVIIFRKLLATLPHEGVILLIVGGLFYMGGIIFYGWKKLRFHHAIWHLFVLGGSICHYLAILIYVLPIVGPTN
ncbi:MAG TPA: hypothetical protein ENH11_09840 [Candidatus Acetothermia bacterium]|nr:hypothetical protein [Candidatus Acetothermia bacterium]